MPQLGEQVQLTVNPIEPLLLTTENFVGTGVYHMRQKSQKILPSYNFGHTMTMSGKSRRLAPRKMKFRFTLRLNCTEFAKLVIMEERLQDLASAGQAAFCLMNDFRIPVKEYGNDPERPLANLTGVPVKDNATVTNGVIAYAQYQIFFVLPEDVENRISGSDGLDCATASPRYGDDRRPIAFEGWEA